MARNRSLVSLKMVLGALRREPGLLIFLKTFRRFWSRCHIFRTCSWFPRPPAPRRRRLRPSSASGCPAPTCPTTCRRPTTRSPTFRSGSSRRWWPRKKPNRPKFEAPETKIRKNSSDFVTLLFFSFLNNLLHFSYSQKKTIVLSLSLRLSWLLI